MPRAPENHFLLLRNLKCDLRFLNGIFRQEVSGSGAKSGAALPGAGGGRAAPLLSLRRALGGRATRLAVVHRKSAAALTTRAIAPGVEAMDIEELTSILNGKRD